LQGFGRRARTFTLHVPDGSLECDGRRGRCYADPESHLVGSTALNSPKAKETYSCGPSRRRWLSLRGEDNVLGWRKKDPESIFQAFTRLKTPTTGQKRWHRLRRVSIAICKKAGVDRMVAISLFSKPVGKGTKSPGLFPIAGQPSRASVFAGRRDSARSFSVRANNTKGRSAMLRPLGCFVAGRRKPRRSARHAGGYR